MLAISPRAYFVGDSVPLILCRFSIRLRIRNCKSPILNGLDIQSSARDQAYFFLKQVRLENGDLPPVLDVEHKPQDRNVEDFQRDILTWLHIVEDKYHVKPIIYTYYKFKENYLNSSHS